MMKTGSAVKRSLLFTYKSYQFLFFILIHMPLSLYSFSRMSKHKLLKHIMEFVNLIL